MTGSERTRAEMGKRMWLTNPRRPMGRIVPMLFAVAFALISTVLPVAAQLDQAFVEEQVAKVDLGSTSGSFQLVIIEPDGTISADSVGENPGGDLPGPNDNYRVGSITKTSPRLWF